MWQLTPFEHNIAIFQGYFKCYNEISLDFPLLAPADFSAWALELKPKAATEKQFKVIEALLKKADTVVNAGDPDDEGQLLIREIRIHRL